MSWSHWVHDAQSGQPIVEVFPSAGGQSMAINEAGSGQHTFQLKDAEWGKTLGENRFIFERWTRAIVPRWNGKSIGYAGLIVSDDYDFASGELTVGHLGLGTIATRRFPFMVPTYGPGAFTVVGKSMRGIARALLAKAYLSTPGDNWHFPVVLPADEAGSFSKEWQNYNFPTMAEMLADVKKEQNGPDIDLRARVSESNWLDWEARIGSPRLAGQNFEWDASAEDSPITNLKVIGDARKQSSGVFALGNGQEDKKLIGRAGGLLNRVDIPDMDVARFYSQTDDQGALDRFAMSELLAARDSVEEFSFNTLASQGVDSMWLGSNIRVNIDYNPWVDAGHRDFTLMGLSTDLSESVKLEVQYL